MAGLWTLAVGVAGSVDVLVGLGIVVMAARWSCPARVFLRAAVTGTIGYPRGPGRARRRRPRVPRAGDSRRAWPPSSESAPGRRAAVVCVLLVGIGWATGVILGHLGKLVSLSGWGAWPPGPRPKQADLYPRRGWQVEVVLFAVGVELLALGVLAELGADVAGRCRAARCRRGGSRSGAASRRFVESSSAARVSA